MKNSKIKLNFILEFLLYTLNYT